MEKKKANPTIIFLPFYVLFILCVQDKETGEMIIQTEEEERKVRIIFHRKAET